MVFSPETMSAYNTKAAMYREEGKHDDARDLLHHGLRSARDTCGEDSEVTMSMMHNYGSLLIELQKYDEAAPLLEECLERRRDVLGEGHKDTCATYANLAIMLNKQGKLHEELAVRRQHVAARKQLDDDEKDPETLKETQEATAHLCNIMIELDLLEEAMPIISEMFESFVAIYGKGCKDYVPQGVLSVGSALYGKLMQRPNRGGDVKGGARLVAALMSVVTDRNAQQPEQTEAANWAPAQAASQALASTPTASAAAPTPTPAPTPPPARASTGGANSAASDAQITTISDLLRSVGLSQYCATFEEEEMELSVMRDALARQGRGAVDDVLKELGVTVMGHRTKITNALAQ